jgi:hypothetical protein
LWPEIKQIGRHGLRSKRGFRTSVGEKTNGQGGLVRKTTRAPPRLRIAILSSTGLCNCSIEPHVKMKRYSTLYDTILAAVLVSLSLNCSDSAEQTVPKKRVAEPKAITEEKQDTKEARPSEPVNTAFSPTWTRAQKKRLVKVKEDKSSKPISLSRKYLKAPPGRYRVQVVAGPIYGLLSKTSGKGPLKTTYTPSENYNGYDEFDYILTYQSNKEYGPFKVPVQVLPKNDAPRAIDPGTYVTTEDEATNEIVLNGWDIEDGEDSLQAKIVRPALHGKLSPIFGPTPLHVTYTPNQNFHGTDGFRFRVTDKEGKPSRPVTVTIQVRPVVDAPRATALPPIRINEDQSSDPIFLSGKDVDGQEANLRVEIVTKPKNGQVTPLSGRSPLKVRYKPQENFHGTDQFRFVVRDLEGVSSTKRTIRINVESIPDAPEATGPGLSTTQINRVSEEMTLSGWDVEDPTEALLVKIVKRPKHGFLSKKSGQAPLLVTYTPKSDYYGKDRFFFIVEDKDGVRSKQIEVPIEVFLDNKPPSVDPISKLVARLGEPFIFQVSASDPDQWTIAKDTLVYSIVENNLPGWLVLDAETGVLKGTPKSSDLGSVERIEVRATDKKGAFATSNPFQLDVIHGRSATIRVQKPAPQEAVMNENWETFSFLLEDNFGNLDMTDNETRIRLSKIEGPGRLRGKLTVRAVNGSAQFSHISADKDGIYKLNITADRNNQLLKKDFDGALTISIKPHPTIRLSSGRLLETGDQPTDVHTADFNEDGATDIIVANKRSDDLSIFWGRAGGTMWPEERIATENGPSALGIIDYNLDGRMDFAVAHQHDNTLVLFKNIGTKSFKKTITLQTENEPVDVKVVDLNQDDKPDLIVTNSRSNSISIFSQKQNSRFALADTLQTGSTPTGTALADVNADGFVDIAVSHKKIGFVFLFFGAADHSYSAPVRIPVPKHSVQVGFIQYNRDGFIDLAVLNYKRNELSILLSESKGQSFSVTDSFPTGEGPIGMRQVHLNDDGKPDIMVSNLFSESVSVFHTNEEDGLTPANDVAVGMNPESFALANLNQDEHLDLIATMNVSNENQPDIGFISIHLGTGKGKFEGPARYGEDLDPASVISGDLNRDGLIDLVAADPFAGQVQVYLQNQNRKFNMTTGIESGDSPHGLVLHDFNFDGLLDLAVADQGTNEIEVYLGDGKGSFGEPRSVSTGKKPLALLAGDFDKNQTQDLISADSASNQISFFRGKGNGKFKKGKTFAVGGSPIAIYAEDFNHDGKLDVLSVNKRSRDASILFGGGKKIFKAEKRIKIGNRPIDSALSDINNDGNLDLLILSQERIHIFESTSKGFFHRLEAVAVPGVSKGLASVDLDRDGNSELIVSQYNKDAISVWVGAGNGFFAPPQYFLAGRGPEALLVTDLNGDGVSDLLTSNARSGQFSIIRGQ